MCRLHVAQLYRLSYSGYKVTPMLTCPCDIYIYIYIYVYIYTQYVYNYIGIYVYLCLSTYIYIYTRNPADPPCILFPRAGGRERGLLRVAARLHRGGPAPGGPHLPRSAGGRRHGALGEDGWAPLGRTARPVGPFLCCCWVGSLDLFGFLDTPHISFKNGDELAMPICIALL